MHDADNEVASTIISPLSEFSELESDFTASKNGITDCITDIGDTCAMTASQLRLGEEGDDVRCGWDYFLQIARVNLGQKNTFLLTTPASKRNRYLLFYICRALLDASLDEFPLTASIRPLECRMQFRYRLLSHGGFMSETGMMSPSPDEALRLLALSLFISQQLS